MKKLLILLGFVFSATVASAQGSQISWKEDTAANRRVFFKLVDATDGETPETGLTISGSECQVSENGAAYANCSGSVSEVGSGLYYYTLDDTPTDERDTVGVLVLKIAEAAANTVESTVQIIADSSGEAQSCTSTTIVLQSDSSSTDDFYNKQVVSFLEGNAKSVSRVCNDYTGSSKTCTVDSMPANCSSGDRYAILPGATALTASLTTDVESGGGGSSTEYGAVAASQKLILDEDGVTAATKTRVVLPQNFHAAKLYLYGDYVSGSGATLDVTVEHSPDGVQYFTVGSFTQIGTSDAGKEIVLTEPLFQYVRAVVTLGGSSPNYNVVVQAWGSNQP